MPRYCQEYEKEALRLFEKSGRSVNVVRNLLLLAFVATTLISPSLAQQTKDADDDGGWGYGFFFFSANGLFNLDENTSDPALGFGGGLDVKRIVV